MVLSYAGVANSRALFQGMGDSSSSRRRSSDLISKNIIIDRHRTSVRLEPEIWDALRDITARERCSLNMLCSEIYRRKRLTSSLTASIRVFVTLYYRAAATDDGHARAGHGAIVARTG